MELAAHAKSIGATSVSSMPPYVGCTKTFDVVKEFYTRFCAAAAPLPVVGYQIPTITGVNLNTAQMGELMEIDGFCGFKYTEGDLYVTLHGGYIDRTNRQRLIEAELLLLKQRFKGRSFSSCMCVCVCLCVKNLQCVANNPAVCTTTHRLFRFNKNARCRRRR